MSTFGLLACGFVAGLVVASALAWGTVVELLEDNDTLRSAVEEWAEAHAALPEIGHADTKPYHRFERAEEALHALAEDSP